MMDGNATRREFGKLLGIAIAGGLMPASLSRNAYAATDTVREGIQIGGLGALRSTMTGTGKKIRTRF